MPCLQRCTLLQRHMNPTNKNTLSSATTYLSRRPKTLPPPLPPLRPLPSASFNLPTAATTALPEQCEAQGVAGSGWKGTMAGCCCTAIADCGMGWGVKGSGVVATGAITGMLGSWLGF